MARVTSTWAMSTDGKMAISPSPRLAPPHGCRSSLSLPQMEEPLQTLGIGLVSPDVEAVDVGPAEGRLQFLLTRVGRLREQRPHLGMPGVQFQHFIGLGVTQCQEPDVWQRRSRGSLSVTATQSCRWLATASAFEQSGPRKSLIRKTTQRRRCTRPRYSSALEMSVSALIGSVASSSRISRKTLPRPLRGGMYWTTSSAKNSKSHLVVVLERREHQNGGNLDGRFGFA